MDSLLKPGGALYYQTLDPEDEEKLAAIWAGHGCVTANRELDERYGFSANYWKIVKKAS